MVFILEGQIPELTELMGRLGNGPYKCMFSNHRLSQSGIIHGFCDDSMWFDLFLIQGFDFTCVFLFDDVPFDLQSGCDFSL